MSLSAISTIWALFQEKGDADYHGEAVSQIEHALQAAQIALNETSDLELAVAALLHDIGHFW
ncbi:MAG: HD domain-containing protein [Saprospiraceae bacterium]